MVSLFVGGEFGVGGFPNAIVAADFNDDGHVDLATGKRRGEGVSVLLGDGSGGFNATAEIRIGTDGASIVAGDFNGDGRVDLAVGGKQRGNPAGRGDGGFISAVPQIGVGFGNILGAAW